MIGMLIAAVSHDDTIALASLVFLTIHLALVAGMVAIIMIAD